MEIVGNTDATQFAQHSCQDNHPLFGHHRIISTTLKNIFFFSYCSCVIFITSYEMDFHMLGILRINICNGCFRKLRLLFYHIGSQKKKNFSLVNFSTLLFINLNSKLKRRKVVDDNLIFHFFYVANVRESWMKNSCK